MPELRITKCKCTSVTVVVLWGDFRYLIAKVLEFTANCAAGVVVRTSCPKPVTAAPKSCGSLSKAKKLSLTCIAKGESSRQSLSVPHLQAQTRPFMFAVSGQMWGFATQALQVAEQIKGRVQK